MESVAVGNVCQKMAQFDNAVDLALCHFKVEVSAILYYFGAKAAGLLYTRSLEYYLSAS